MQQRGLITKAPHSITICDQPALAQQSCECFHLTKEATDGYIDAVTRLSLAYAH
jgi:hypothetical protein